MKFFRPLLCALLLLTLTACASRTGPPGSPLPPSNKAVGDKWPPEVREFVEVFTTRFADGQPVPTNEQIEQWLHVRTVEDPVEAKRHYFYRRIQDWPLGFADDLGRSSYWKASPDPDGQEYMQIGLGVDTSRYCINPYDLAIYTGFRFEPDLPPISSPHDVLPERPRDPWGKIYSPDYVWGMFSRAPGRIYRGNNFLRIFLTEDLRCIDWIGANTFFQIGTMPDKE